MSELYIFFGPVRHRKKRKQTGGKRRGNNEGEKSTRKKPSTVEDMRSKDGERDNKSRRDTGGGHGE